MAEAALPVIEGDKFGLTEEKFKMIEILACSGHTDSEICKKLSISRGVLTRWMKTGVSDRAEGTETIYSQLLEAIAAPRMDKVEKLEATLMGKALGKFKGKSRTYQKRDEEGNPYTETETDGIPNSNDLKYLLEANAPEKYGLGKVGLNLKLEAVIPQTPIMDEDEWAKKYSNIQEAEIVEEGK